MAGKCIVVRHSERIDEVDEILWHQLCEGNSNARAYGLIAGSCTEERDQYSLINDPPITANGVLLVKDAASTLCKLIDGLEGGVASTAAGGEEWLGTAEKSVEVKIFSSRLTRSLQTAYYIALLLDKPIYVTSGLALTAAAVAKRKGKYQFQSTETIQQLCPGVEIIDCDQDQPAADADVVLDDDDVAENGKNNGGACMESCARKDTSAITGSSPILLSRPSFSESAVVSTSSAVGSGSIESKGHFHHLRQHSHRYSHSHSYNRHIRIPSENWLETINFIIRHCRALSAVHSSTITATTAPAANGTATTVTGTSAITVSAAADTKADAGKPRHVVPIFVCHRETIRNLVSTHFRIPYCGMAVFDFNTEHRRLIPPTWLGCKGNSSRHSSNSVIGGGVGIVGDGEAEGDRNRGAAACKDTANHPTQCHQHYQNDQNDRNVQSDSRIGCKRAHPSVVGINLFNSSLCVRNNNNNNNNNNGVCVGGGDVDYEDEDENDERKTVRALFSLTLLVDKDGANVPVPMPLCATKSRY